MTEIEKSPELLLKLKSISPNANTAQAKICDFMINHFFELGDMALAELASKSGVSEASVSRYVKTLGYKNYREFQVDVLLNCNQKIARQPEKNSYEAAMQVEGTKELISRIFRANIQCLMDTQAMVQSDNLEMVAKKIVHKRALVIYAQGRSKVTADSIRLRLYRLNIRCSVYSDPHEQAVTSSLIHPDDLVMGVSTFGSSTSVLRSCRRAKRNGAYVIAVTSYSDTPLEKIADVLLMTSSSEHGTFGVEPSTTSVSQQVLLDCLYVLIYKSLSEEAKKCLQKSKDAIDEERSN